MEPKKQIVELHNGVWELALKLWRTLILCTILCAVIVFSLSGIMVSGTWGLLLTQLICFIVMGFTIYSQMWSVGDRDANFIHFGRMQRDIWKSLKIGLIALIPGFVTNIPLALSKAGVFGNFDFLPFYRVLQAPIWPLINLIHPYGAIPHEAVAATELFEGSPATAGMTWGQLVLMAIIPLVYLIFVVAGYELGIRRISVGFKLVYEKNDKDKGKKK